MHHVAIHCINYVYVCVHRSRLGVGRKQVYCLLPHWLVMVADHCDVPLFALLLHQGAVRDICECNYVCLLVTHNHKKR